MECLLWLNNTCTQEFIVKIIKIIGQSLIIETVEQAQLGYYDRQQHTGVRDK